MEKQAGLADRQRGAEIEAVGLARAKGFEAQKQALGAETTALVNVVSELAKAPTASFQTSW
jgi:hypothetical protein